MSTAKKKAGIKAEATRPTHLPRFFIFCGGPREAEVIIRRFALPPQEVTVLKDREQLQAIPPDLPIICLKGTGWRRHSLGEEINGWLSTRSASVWEEEI
jgi:hypothetical protein